MTTKDEALKLALDLATMHHTDDGYSELRSKVRQLAKEILAQPEQEPVVWLERQARRMQDGVVIEWTSWYPCQYKSIDDAKAESCDDIPYEWRPLYTTPPKRKPLTDEEIVAIEKGIWKPEFFDSVEIQANREFARAIEAAHGITGE